MELLINSRFVFLFVVIKPMEFLLDSKVLYLEDQDLVGLALVHSERDNGVYMRLYDFLTAEDLRDEKSFYSTEN